MAGTVLRAIEPLFELNVGGLWLAGYVEASGFEQVAFVLRAVLLAQVSAAVGTVLYCQYLAVGAYCAPHECHFVSFSGSSHRISDCY